MSSCVRSPLPAPLTEKTALSPLRESDVRAWGRTSGTVGSQLSLPVSQCPEVFLRGPAAQLGTRD